MRWLPRSGTTNAPDPAARAAATVGSELFVATVAAATAGGSTRCKKNWGGGMPMPKSGGGMPMPKSGGGMPMPKSGGGGNEAARCTWTTFPPPPTLGDANLSANVPSGPNTCTRSLPVSATAIARPNDHHATDLGPLNCPSAGPFDPKLTLNTPSGRNTWTRSLPVSATAIVPSGDTATPSGDENCPSPEPDKPKLRMNMPSIWKTCTRSLPVSATAIV